MVTRMRRRAIALLIGLSFLSFVSLGIMPVDAVKRTDDDVLIRGPIKHA